MKAQDQLAELSSDGILKVRFADMPLDTIWLTVEREFPDLVSECLRIIIPFASTYLCETGFAAYTCLHKDQISFATE